MSKINERYTSDDRYGIVDMEFNDRPVQAIELYKIPYSGIIVVFNRVELIPRDDESVTLSFDYDFIRELPGSWKKEDLDQYLGGILEEIIRDKLAKNELVFAGGTDENREDNIIELN
jgi:hypothetical protein